MLKEFQIFQPVPAWSPQAFLLIAEVDSAYCQRCFFAHKKNTNASIQMYFLLRIVLILQGELYSMMKVYVKLLLIKYTCSL